MSSTTGNARDALARTGLMSELYRRGISTSTDIDSYHDVLKLVAERTHEVLSGSSKIGLVDRLVLTVWAGEAVNLTDDAKHEILRDVASFQPKGKASATVNRSLRELMRWTDPVRSLVVSASSSLTWRYRVGLQHPVPTICCFCDLIAAVAEHLRCGFREAAQAVGSVHGHFKVFSGRLPMSLNQFEGSTPSIKFGDVGTSWTEIGGSVSPQNSKKNDQIKKQIAVSEIHESMKACFAPQSPTPPPKSEEVEFMDEEEEECPETPIPSAPPPPKTPRKILRVKNIKRKILSPTVKKLRPVSRKLFMSGKQRVGKIVEETPPAEDSECDSELDAIDDGAVDSKLHYVDTHQGI